MPPFTRFWVVYVLFGLVSLFLILGATFLLGAKNLPPTVWVLFGGVIVAAVSIAANSWTAWRSSCVSHALSALQTLRTDREYLINAYVVNTHAHPLGSPLSATAQGLYEDRSQPSTVDAPSFRDASLFLLNQYEVLAAGVRNGAIDFRLIETTMRAPVLAIVQTYGRQIEIARAKNPRTLSNLLWLYRKFRGMPPFDRGPVP